MVSMSKKQKLNARISIDTELISVHDAMPQMRCSLYFIQAQGYKAKTKLNQDNMTLLEQNRKESPSKRSKHIHIRYLSKTE